MSNLPPQKKFLATQKAQLAWFVKMARAGHWHPITRAIAGRILHSRALRAALPRIAYVLPASRFPRDWGVSPDIAATITRYQSQKKPHNRKVVYTAIFGASDLLTVPDILENDCDYVCFSDHPVDGYGVWKILASPYSHADATRMARYIKTHPHSLFPQHEIAIWVDANITIRQPLAPFIEKMEQENSDVAFISHPWRDCLYEEGEACLLHRKDAAEAINRQLAHYRQKNIPPHAGLIESGAFIARIRETRVQQMFRDWWHDIDRFSRRDQLSLIPAMLSSGVKRSEFLGEGFNIRNHPAFSIYRHGEGLFFSTPAALKPFSQIESPQPLTGIYTAPSTGGA